MFSWEIDRFLQERNYCLNRDEYMELTPQKNNQIARVTYDTSNNKFHIYTYDGYDWEFVVKNN